MPFEFPTAIDNTMRSTFTSCPRKFFYSHIRHLASPQPSIHLHAGATFARGLEVFRKEFALGNSHSHSIDEAKAAMIAEWGDFEPCWSFDNGPVKSLDTLLEGLDYYIAAFPPEHDPVQIVSIPPRGPCVEFSAALPIPDETGYGWIEHPETGDPLLYAGRFDALVEKDNQLFCLDDKTTSQMGAQWGNQWTLRSQFTGYQWLASQFGLPVIGTIIRGLAIRKTGFGHAQAITFRPDWQIERWLRELQRTVRQMLAHWDHLKYGNFDYPEQHWPAALDDACTAYGGCIYAELENIPPSHRERWIKADFVERHWSPLAADPQGAQ